jgi:pyridoxamine 5'-phosphate oxidase
MRSGLSEEQAGADPLRLFSAWLEEAVRAGLPLPNAMTLATVSAEGAPDARIVLLKGLERGGFAFYTNYASRKAHQMDARPLACLVFQWSELERQVRIEGEVEKVSAAESDAYFASRPLGARLSAWASAQSACVASRKVLEDAMEEARRRHGDAPPRPPHWGGYRVLPRRLEFWQGRADRLHDRLLYTASGARLEDRAACPLRSSPPEARGTVRPAEDAARRSALGRRVLGHLARRPRARSRVREARAAAPACGAALAGAGREKSL